MSILPYQEIQRRIKDGQLVRGGDIDQCLGPASYELRIGSIQPFESGAKTKLEAGQKFVMEPGSSVLVGTHEEVQLPGDLAGLLFLKSSLGRSGYIPWSQGFVDPGYKGSLTIALHNFAGKLQLFQGHQKICHLVFVKLTEATSNPYEGEYSGSKDVTGSKEKPPIVVGPSGWQVMAQGARAFLDTAADQALKTAVSNGVHSLINPKG